MSFVLPALLLGAGLVTTAAIATSRPIRVETDVRPTIGKSTSQREAERQAKEDAANADKPVLERWGITATTPAVPAIPKLFPRQQGEPGATAPQGRRPLVVLPKLFPRQQGAPGAATAPQAKRPLIVIPTRQPAANGQPRRGLFGLFARKPAAVAGVSSSAVVQAPGLGKLGYAVEDLAAKAKAERVPVEGPFVSPSRRVVGVTVDLDGADDREASARLGLRTAAGIAAAQGIQASGVENLGHGLYFYWFAAPGWTRDDVLAAIDAPKAMVGCALRERERVGSVPVVGSVDLNPAELCVAEVRHAIERPRRASAIGVQNEDRSCSIRCTPYPSEKATILDLARVAAARHFCQLATADVGGDLFLRFTVPAVNVPAATTLRAARA